MLLSLSSLTTITEFSLEIIGKIVRKALSNLLRYGIKNLIGLVLNLFGKTSAIRLTYFANLYLGIGGVRTQKFITKQTE